MTNELVYATLELFRLFGPLGLVLILTLVATILVLIITDERR